METLRRVVAGESLARYGDGELKLCRFGIGIKSQQADEGLTVRLRQILDHSGACRVGIPNIQSQTPKADFWGKVAVWARAVLTERPYGSA
jgi:hypothetical protein